MVGPTTNRLTSFSFHVNRPSILRILLFHNLTLKVQCKDHSSWSHSWSHILLTNIPYGQGGMSGHTHTHTTPTHFFPPIPRPLFTFFSGTPAQNSNFCPRPPPIWPPPIFRQKPPYPRPTNPRIVWTPAVPDLTSFWPMGKPIWGKWANYYGFAQLQV